MQHRVVKFVSPLLAAGVVVVAAGTAAIAAPEPPPLASGHAEVIAQGVVDLDASSYHWSPIAGHLDPGAISTTSGSTSPTFVHAISGVLTVTSGGSAWRLAAGEAALLAGEADELSETAVENTSLTPSDNWMIELTREETGGAGPTSFSPGAGQRDLDLLRDVLAAGEALTIPDQEFPVFLLVTAGSVSATGGDGAPPTALAAGQSATFPGEVVVTNDSDVEAIVVAAIVGPTVDVTGPTTTASPTTSPSTTLAPPTTSTTSTSTTTTSTSTTTPAADEDGDGLSDDDELNIYNTAPDKPDSDFDGLGDYDEVIVIGTDPTDPDTDADGLDDGPEIDPYGSDPFDEDSDDDLITDGEEVHDHGTSPTSSDTDGDSFDDFAEIDTGFDPLDATDHP